MNGGSYEEEDDRKAKRKKKKTEYCEGHFPVIERTRLIYADIIFHGQFFCLIFFKLHKTMKKKKEQKKKIPAKK